MCPITDLGLISLSKSQLLDQLQVLRIGEQAVADAGVNSLLYSPLVSFMKLLQVKCHRDFIVDRKAYKHLGDCTIDFS
jgi:hypothetical protein